MDLLALVMAPLEFELTRRALLELTLLGLACGALGVLVVLRGLAFIGDALGHCVVAGVACAYLLHGPLELCGGAAALLSGWGMVVLASVGRYARLGGDAGIAVVFTTMFALGLGLISVSRSYLTDLTEILFGNVLSVDLSDLAISAACAALIVVLLIAFFRPLVLVAFDPTAAAALGLPRGQLDLLLYALIATAIVSGAVAAGSLLVTALVVVPAATARLVARDVRGQMLLAAGLACVSGWSGLYASFYWRLASGGTVVVASVTLFVLGLVISSVGGLLARRRVPRPATRELSGA